METFIHQFETLPQYLGGHLTLSASALLVGLCISLPLGIIASQNPRIERISLSIAGVIQTIPSLALLALMVPLLGGRIGALPAFIALMLYSILPILRNTVTGISEVDRTVVEAARGMGMTKIQILRRVQIPLALPMIVAGIRTSTIWVIGIATLATPVGADSLGYYIFMGLNTKQFAITMFGCVFSALLALLLDRLIEFIESSVQQARTTATWFGTATLCAIFLGGALGPTLWEWSQSADRVPFTQQDYTPSQEGKVAKPTRLPLEGKAIVIGGKPFTEQYILAHLIAEHLRALGADVDVRNGLGSKILFDALANSTVDVYVDYTGTIWATVMKRQEPVDPERALVEVGAYLLEKFGILTLGVAGFENAYAFAMKKDRAHQLGIESITDLAQQSSQLRIAGDFDFFGRPEGKHVIDLYGLDFQKRINMDSRLMYDAVANDSVDVVTAYTSDGQILAYDLMILDDPKNAFPPYDAILLTSPEAATQPKVLQALKFFVNQISDKDMRWANKSVDLEQRPIEDVAQDLYEKIEARLTPSF